MKAPAQFIEEELNQELLDRTNFVVSSRYVSWLGQFWSWLADFIELKSGSY